jgi:hypothetical protein
LKPSILVAESEGFDVGGGGEPVVERVGIGAYNLNICLIREAGLAVGEVGVALVIDWRDVDTETDGDGVIDFWIVASACSSPVASKSSLVAELLAAFHYIHYAGGELEIRHGTRELNLYLYITMTVI